VLRATLEYDRGTVTVRSPAHIPFAVLDPRTNVQRAQAMHYSNIVQYLKNSGIEYDDRVVSGIMAPPLPTMPALRQGGEPPLRLRDYQQEAVERWLAAGMRGCVVLPTGSGKSLVGVKAIERANAAALVVVPTLDLMAQWISVFAQHFPGVKIGSLGGGSDDIRPITVSTYDSAYLRAPFLGNRFALAVFDEVHHLAAPGYRTIAEQMVAPFRLGLTATIEREDELHRDLPGLVGGVVYQASPDALARKKFLAQYEVERRKVELLPEEQREYRQNMQKYHECMAVLVGNAEGRQNAISIERLVMMSGRNPAARQALLARNRASHIALNSKAKLEELKEILAENTGVKTIIFTQHNSMVYGISDRFLIPFITHKTHKEERQDVLQGFKDGRYTAIVTSKVLDEGVDVPDAEIGIILSGTGSAREFIQRLGRLLRPGRRRTTAEEEKKARLIEIVSAETREETITSAKRKRALGTIRSSSLPPSQLREGQQQQSASAARGRDRATEGKNKSKSEVQL